MDLVEQAKAAMITEYVKAPTAEGWHRLTVALRPDPRVAVGAYKEPGLLVGLPERELEEAHGLLRGELLMWGGCRNTAGRVE